MAVKAFIDNAKVMSKGQITIPKDIRNVLGVTSGDRVTFVVENDSVRIFNTAVYAMQRFRSEMKGEAECNGLTSEESILSLVKSVRSEGNV